LKKKKREGKRREWGGGGEGAKLNRLFVSLGVIL
jgi:hypothetical protein